MKIVLVNVWLDAERGGGTAERTRWLALHLANLGCQCTIVTMGPTPWLADFTEAGIDVMQVGFVGQRFPIPLLHPVKLLRLFRAADIVHVMGFWFMLAALCSILAHSVGTPLVLCPAGSLTKYGRSARLKRTYFEIIGRRMISASKTVIATTEQERRLFISDFDIEPKKIFISPNGIDASEAEIPVALASPKERSILFVGRLTGIKAPDLLLEAFAAVAATMADVSLVIAGPDLGLRTQLEQRAAELGLQSRVSFTGFVDEEKRTALLSQTSLLVVPSHSEVMSMVALEAGAMGVPVLLTDQCGFDEVASIGGGRVVPVDITALSEAMQQMMSDDNLLKVQGQRLRTFVLENYAWQNVAGKLLGHFRDLQPFPQRSENT